MIINFELGNYRSYKGDSFFTMQRATNIKVVKDSIATKYKDSLSRVAAIYGANASGKSNFLRGLSTVSEMVRGAGTSYTHQQFKLSRENNRRDSDYRITFIADDTKKYVYEYSYGVNGVSYEELNVYESQKPSLLFRRERKRAGDVFDFGEKFTSDSVKAMITNETKTRSTVLLLAMLRGWDEKVTRPAYTYLADEIYFMEAFDYHKKYEQAKERIRDDERFMQYINKSLAAVDLGISEVSVSKPPDVFVDHVMRTLKDNGEVVERKRVVDEFSRVKFKHFGVDETLGAFGEMEESSGTIAALAFLSLFYDALRDGSTCLIDELESSLHPILVAKLIEVFNDKRTNPKGAQLIFTTHDISLIENYAEGEVLDRDQIWFVEKNQKGESELYPLTSVQEMPREGANIGMKYIHGRYGATPNVSLFGAMLGTKLGDERRSS